MKRILLIVIIFSNIFVYSQVTFEKKFTINSYSSSSSILQLEDEGYVLVGNERIHENDIQQDILLVKLNKNGDVSWSTHFGSQDNEYGNDVKQTYDMGFIIIGSTTNNSSDPSDVYLIKTDSLGNLIWDYSYDISDYDVGYSITQTSDSGYIVVGESRIIEGPNSIPHLLIMRIDKTGEIVWSKVYSTPYEGGKSIIQTNDSCFIVCGYTKPENDFWSNFLVFKINSEGDSIWSRNYGGSLKEYANSIKQLDNNDLIISGYRADTNNLNEVDSYFVKSNADGDTIWTRIFSGIGYDISTSVEITNDGNFAFTGYGEMNEMGNKDVYLLKMSSDGDTIWNRVFGGPTTEYGESLKQTSDDGYIICGVAFDYDTLYPYGRGIYIIKTDKYGNVINTSIIENKNQQFEVFPNPCTNEFTIKASKPISLVEIIDVYGNKKHYKVLTSSQYEYKYSGAKLERGFYIIKISIEDSSSTRILIVE